MARRPAGAAAILGFFLLAAFVLLAYVQPWETLGFSTWPSGYEAGRIARNLHAGLGYTSPFVALPGDDFLSSDPRDGAVYPGTAEPAVQAEVTAGRWPTAWITPPYVALWYLSFVLFGPYTVASAIAYQAAQILLMALALGLAWALVRAVHGETAALFALLFLLLYPPTWYFALEDTHGTALFIALVMLTLLTLRWVLEGGGTRARAGHGLAVGLAVLTEPSSVLFYAWLEAWAAWRLRRTPRKAKALLLTTAACGALIVGPWLARNIVTMRSPILFKSNLPMELFYGNNPEAEADAFVAHVHRFPAWSEEERLRLLEIGETAYARLCGERAAAFIGSEPLAFARLTLHRIIYYWSFNPYRVLPMRPLLTLIFNMVLALWLFATVALGRGRLVWLDGACLGFFLLFPPAYYVTQFMIYRYRYPVEALLLISAASAVTRLAGAGGPAGAALSAARGSLPAAGTSGQPGAR